MTQVSFRLSLPKYLTLELQIVTVLSSSILFSYLVFPVLEPLKRMRVIMSHFSTHFYFNLPLLIEHSILTRLPVISVIKPVHKDRRKIKPSKKNNI